MRAVGLVALLLTAIGSSSLAQPCRPISGLKPLLRPDTALLLGEVHGTEESPAFALNVACHAARADLPVVLGLELSRDEQERVDGFLSSRGSEEDRRALLAGAPWQSPYQDGRASESMFELLDGVRRLRGEGLSLRLALFDAPSAGGGQQRDRAMAANLTRVVADSPGAMLIVLTGNRHSRITPGSARNRDFEPMGFLLERSASPQNLIALNVSHGGGSAWICAPDCGIVELSGRAQGTAWSVEIDDGTRPAGHSGWYHVGPITASPPAHPSGRDARRTAPTTAQRPAETRKSARSPDETPTGSAGEPGSDPGIQGEWQAYDFSSNTRTWIMRFEGSAFRAEGGPDDWYEGEITVHPKERPAQIDFEIHDCRCSFKGETSQAIYYWDGESIVVSAPRPGSPRPQRFAETTGQMMRLRQLEDE